MSNTDSFKIELLDKLWLPKTKEAKSLMFPRRRNNARMTLLTLTDGISMREILKLEKENLILRESVVAWVSTMNKRWRVEAESIGCVHGDVYNDLFLASPSCEVVTKVPFDIINLDFESQQPVITQDRIRKEIGKLEKIIDLQNQQGCNKFVLIYTTFVDTDDIDTKDVAQGVGLNLEGFADTVTDLADKQNFLRVIFEKLVEKYAYKWVSDVTYLSYVVTAGTTWLFSIAGIITR